MTKRIVQLGFLLTFALILAAVESFIPFSFGIPGIKLGLPNLVVVLLLSQEGIGRFGVRDAVLVNLSRILLAGFMFGSLYTILYALAGAALSLCAMLAGRRAGCFSTVGISVLGGVFHNIGQIIVAVLVTQTVYIGYYVPFLIAAGTLTGAVLGLAAMELAPYLTRPIDGR